MNYFIIREAQEYGPYTLSELESYVASGNIQLTDMARSDTQPQPMLVSQILGRVQAPYAGQPYRTMPMATTFYPDPPNLHWALVLLFSVLSCGLFGAIWSIIEASWVKRVVPQSRALNYYIAATVLIAISYVVSFAHAMSQHRNTGTNWLTFAFLVLIIVARFSMKASIEQHFNTAEPMGVSLNPILTFFFGELYFQYHFNEINRRKSLARMSAMPR